MAAGKQLIWASAAAVALLTAAGCERRPSRATAAPRASAPRAADRGDLDEVLARARAAPGQVASGTAADAGPRPPEKLFRAVGCINCHGTGAAYHQRLVDARSKPEADIASWIRHPEKIKPTTAMPSFANLVSEAEALELARWIKRGNPP